ncbi:MAG: pseudomurein-binding protein [Methanobacteriaceae archaeon]|jgi:DNA integrity scanning protein DisA with diadenylate cyclase activity|nr:MAG: pseudomurein-binding protein [Methanobacterium sp. BRmetb2]MCC7558131.1 pseudomurein-binding protein [Methanobacteriaceae archaeon]
MKRLTLEQYREMVDEVIEFKKQNGEMPEFTMINGTKIEKKNIIDIIERVNKFVLEMGRNPRSVDIQTFDVEQYNLVTMK